MKRKELERILYCVPEGTLVCLGMCDLPEISLIIGKYSGIKDEPHFGGDIAIAVRDHLDIGQKPPKIVNQPRGNTKIIYRTHEALETCTHPYGRYDGSRIKHIHTGKEEITGLLINLGLDHLAKAVEEYEG